MIRIEFAGLPGSGKSTLYRLLTKRFTERRENCHSIEEALFLSLKEQSRRGMNSSYLLKYAPAFYVRRRSREIFRQSHCRVEAQNRFLAARPDAFHALLKSENFCYMGTDERLLVISWFLNFASVYQFIEEYYHFDNGIIFNEGFMQKSMSFFVSPNIAYTADSLLSQYLNAVPVPNILIWVDTNVEHCCSRILSRSKRKSLRLKSMSPNEIMSYLFFSKEHFNRVLQWALDQKIHVIFVDNNGSLESAINESLARVLDGLKGLSRKIEFGDRSFAL